MNDHTADNPVVRHAAKYFTASVALKLCVAASAAAGLAYTFGIGGFMGKGETLLYFTIQSNIGIGGIGLLFAVLMTASRIGKKNYIRNWLYILKFIFTVAITLTFLVMTFLLMPQMIASGNSGYLYSPSNLFCHYLAPLLAIADFILFDTSWRNKWRDSFYAAVMPLYYLVFAYLLSFSGVTFSGGEKVPYFFLDYEKLTWFRFTSKGPGVFWWIVFLTIMVIGLGFGLMAVNRARHKLVLS